MVLSSFCMTMWYITGVCVLLLTCGERSAERVTSSVDELFEDGPVEGALPDQYDCYDGAAWFSLMDHMPQFKDCGKRFKNLQGKLAQDNPNLHYSNLGEYPSLAFIVVQLTVIDKTGNKIDIRQTCNGFLFTNQHVMTTARCLIENPVRGYYRTNRAVRAILGDYNSEISGKDCVTTEHNTTCNDPPLIVLVEKTATHPHFDRFSLHHNIAILQLEKTVTFTDYIQPICLPHGCGFEDVGKGFHHRVMTHVGWKIFWPRKAPNISPKTMQKMKKVIVTADRSDGSDYGCDKAYLWFDNYTQLCTHDFPLVPEDQINCDGVTGGPLIVEYGDAQFAMAMASFGEACNFDRSVKNGDPLVMTWLLPYMRWALKTVYYLKTGHTFNMPFTDIKFSIDEEDD